MVSLKVYGKGNILVVLVNSFFIKVKVERQ